MDVPNSEGPESGGVSWLFVVQPADIASTAASAAATVETIGAMRFICIAGHRRRPCSSVVALVRWIREIAEVHAKPAGRADLTASLIVAVERNLRDGRNDHRADLERGEGRFFLRVVPDDLESGGDGIGNGRREPA